MFQKCSDKPRNLVGSGVWTPWNLLRMTCNTNMVRKLVYLYIWAFYPFQMPRVAIRFLLHRADRPLAVIESTECTCIYKMIQYIISLSTYRMFQRKENTCSAAAAARPCFQLLIKLETSSQKKKCIIKNEKKIIYRRPPPPSCLVDSSRRSNIPLVAKM